MDTTLPFTISLPSERDDSSELPMSEKRVGSHSRSWCSSSSNSMPRLWLAFPPRPPFSQLSTSAPPRCEIGNEAFFHRAAQGVASVFPVGLSECTSVPSSLSCSTSEEEAPISSSTAAKRERSHKTESKLHSSPESCYNSSTGRSSHPSGMDRSELEKTMPCAAPVPPSFPVSPSKKAPPLSDFHDPPFLSFQHTTTPTTAPTLIPASEDMGKSNASFFINPTHARDGGHEDAPIPKGEQLDIGRFMKNIADEHVCSSTTEEKKEEKGLPILYTQTKSTCSSSPVPFHEKSITESGEPAKSTPATRESIIQKVGRWHYEDRKGYRRSSFITSPCEAKGAPLDSTPRASTAMCLPTAPCRSNREHQEKASSARNSTREPRRYSITYEAKRKSIEGEQQKDNTPEDFLLPASQDPQTPEQNAPLIASFSVSPFPEQDQQEKGKERFPLFSSWKAISSSAPSPPRFHEAVASSFVRATVEGDGTEKEGEEGNQVSSNKRNKGEEARSKSHEDECSLKTKEEQQPLRFHCPGEENRLPSSPSPLSSHANRGWSPTRIISSFSYPSVPLLSWPPPPSRVQSCEEAVERYGDPYVLRLMQHYLQRQSLEWEQACTYWRHRCYRQCAALLKLWNSKQQERREVANLTTSTTRGVKKAKGLLNKKSKGVESKRINTITVDRLDAGQKEQVGSRDRSASTTMCNNRDSADRKLHVSNRKENIFIRSKETKPGPFVWKNSSSWKGQILLPRKKITRSFIYGWQKCSPRKGERNMSNDIPCVLHREKKDSKGHQTGRQKRSNSCRKTILKGSWRSSSLFLSFPSSASATELPPRKEHDKCKNIKEKNRSSTFEKRKKDEKETWGASSCGMQEGEVPTVISCFSVEKNKSEEEEKKPSNCLSQEENCMPETATRNHDASSGERNHSTSSKFRKNLKRNEEAERKKDFVENGSSNEIHTKKKNSSTSRHSYSYLQEYKRQTSESSSRSERMNEENEMEYSKHPRTSTRTGTSSRGSSIWQSGEVPMKVFSVSPTREVKGGEDKRHSHPCKHSQKCNLVKAVEDLPNGSFSLSSSSNGSDLVLYGAGTTTRAERETKKARPEGKEKEEAGLPIKEEPSSFMSSQPSERTGIHGARREEHVEDLGTRDGRHDSPLSFFSPLSLSEECVRGISISPRAVHAGSACTPPRVVSPGSLPHFAPYEFVLPLSSCPLTVTQNTPPVTLKGKESMQRSPISTPHHAKWGYRSQGEKHDISKLPLVDGANNSMGRMTMPEMARQLREIIQQRQDRCRRRRQNNSLPAHRFEYPPFTLLSPPNDGTSKQQQQGRQEPSCSTRTDTTLGSSHSHTRRNSRDVPVKEEKPSRIFFAAEEHEEEDRTREREDGSRRTSQGSLSIPSSTHSTQDSPPVAAVPLPPVTSSFLVPASSSSSSSSFRSFSSSSSALTTPKQKRREKKDKERSMDSPCLSPLSVSLHLKSAGGHVESTTYVYPSLPPGHAYHASTSVAPPPKTGDHHEKKLREEEDKGSYGGHGVTSRRTRVPNETQAPNPSCPASSSPHGHDRSIRGKKTSQEVDWHTFSYLVAPSHSGDGFPYISFPRHSLTPSTHGTISTTALVSPKKEAWEGPSPAVHPTATATHTMSSLASFRNGKEHHWATPQIPRSGVAEEDDAKRGKNTHEDDRIGATLKDPHNSSLLNPPLLSTTPRYMSVISDAFALLSTPLHEQYKSTNLNDCYPLAPSALNAPVFSEDQAFHVGQEASNSPTQTSAVPTLYTVSTFSSSLSSSALGPLHLSFLPEKVGGEEGSVMETGRTATPSTNSHAANGRWAKSRRNTKRRKVTIELNTSHKALRPETIQQLESHFVLLKEEEAALASSTDRERVLHGSSISVRDHPPTSPFSLLSGPREPGKATTRDGNAVDSSDWHHFSLCDAVPPRTERKRSIQGREGRGQPVLGVAPSSSTCAAASLLPSPRTTTPSRRRALGAPVFMSDSLHLFDDEVSPTDVEVIFRKGGEECSITKRVEEVETEREEEGEAVTYL